MVSPELKEFLELLEKKFHGKIIHVNMGDHIRLESIDADLSSENQSIENLKDCSQCKFDLDFKSLACDDCKSFSNFQKI
jgi:hypothetical protein